MNSTTLSHPTNTILCNHFPLTNTISHPSIPKTANMRVFHLQRMQMWTSGEWAGIREVHGDQAPEKRPCLSYKLRRK